MARTRAWGMIPVLALPLASAELRAQGGCDDARTVAQMARLRQDTGTQDVMCVEFARGDLDGDGRDDAVLDIGYEAPWMEGGGASRLHVLLADPAAPLLAEPEGERGAVQRVVVAGPELRVETLDHRPDDPPCCPSRITELVMRVTGHEVIRVLEP